MQTAERKPMCTEPPVQAAGASEEKSAKMQSWSTEDFVFKMQNFPILAHGPTLACVPTTVPRSKTAVELTDAVE